MTQIGDKLYKNDEVAMARYTDVANDCNTNQWVIIDKGEYYEVTKLPELTQAEKNQKQADKAKAELHSIAVTAMMATLAGSDITAQKTEYQSSIAVLSDDVALLIPEVYPVWSGNSVEYKKDMRVTYNNVLYKVLQNHTSQETWTPTSAPSLFAKVLTSTTGEILEWEQPDSTNPYMKGNKVKFKGKIYESLIDNNVWSPEDYPAGWKEIEEA